MFKPYELVNIKSDGYGYIGQCISKAFDDKIMIRRVPGDPATMIEMEIGRLKKISNPKSYKYVQYAQVNGRFLFPVDMLRYDHCAPVNFAVSSDGAIFEFDDDKLIVGRIVDLKSRRWTIDRWNSFGWILSPLRILSFDEHI